MRVDVADGATGGPSRGSSATTRAESAAPRLGYQPSLDGLRAVAVVAVLLYHGAAINGLEGLHRWTRGGYLGVSAFFTLSGFLITTLLLGERADDGKVSLVGFWSRRARRLLPASLALLAVVCVLAPLLATASQLRSLPGDVWASLGYVLNWHYIFGGQDYSAVFGGAPSPIRHLWSLSVEEQFYFVLPVVAAVALKVGRGRRAPLGVVLAVATVASIGAGIVLAGGEYSNRVYSGTDTRLAEITIGALAALFMFGRRRRTEPSRGTVAVDMLAYAVCGFLLALWMSLDLRDPLLYRGGFAVHALAVVVVLVVATRPFGALRSGLAWLPLVALGRISYGVYLVHWPVMWWATPARLHLPAWGALVAQIAITIAIATLSFRLLEQPIRTGHRVVSWRRVAIPAMVVGAVATTAAVLPEPDPGQLVALGNHPRLVVPTTSAPPATTGAPVSGVPATAQVTTTAAPLPPLKVMVLGDSFAESMTGGLQTWALLSGKMSVLDATIVGCGFGRGGRNKGVGFNRTWPAECRRRDQTVAADLASFRPDVVLIAGGMWDVTDRLIPGATSWSRIGAPAYDAYLTGELAHLAALAGSTGARVIWANSPHWNPIPGSVIFMGPPPYSEAKPERADRFNQLLAAAAATNPNVTILDLAAWMRAQPGGELAPDLRVDGVHFTDESTHRLAEWLGPQVLTTVGRS
jgi:peptidoglycan/LPS O-acetylase OafA/YrhL